MDYSDRLLALSSGLIGGGSLILTVLILVYVLGLEVRTAIAQGAAQLEYDLYVY